MKKIYRLLCIAAVMSVAFACQDIPEEGSLEELSAKVEKGVHCYLPAIEFDTPETKVIDFGDKFTATFDENDKIGVWPYQNDYGQYQTYTLDINTDNTANARFEGGAFVIAEGSTYTSIYPRLWTDEWPDVPISFEGQIQTGNGTTAHLKNYLYAWASATCVSGSTTFNYEYNAGFIQFVLTFNDLETATSFKEVKLIADSNVFAVNPTLNVKEGNLSKGTLTSEISIALKNLSVEPGGTMTVNMAAAPFASCKARVNAIAEDNTVYTSTSGTISALNPGKAKRLSPGMAKMGSEQLIDASLEANEEVELTTNSGDLYVSIVQSENLILDGKKIKITNADGYNGPANLYLTVVDFHEPDYLSCDLENLELTIDLPNTHVVLSAAAEEKIGAINTITSLNTLVLGEKITVGSVAIQENGGGLTVDGKITGTLSVPDQAAKTKEEPEKVWVKINESAEVGAIEVGEPNCNLYIAGKVTTVTTAATQNTVEGTVGTIAVAENTAVSPNEPDMIWVSINENATVTTANVGETNCNLYIAGNVATVTTSAAQTTVDGNIATALTANESAEVVVTSSATVNANATLTAYDRSKIYLVAGSDIPSQVQKNGNEETGAFTGTITVDVHPEASVDGVEYMTLAKALAMVPTNGVKTTVKLLSDVTLEEGFTVAATQNMVLDLNGFTLSEVLSQSGTSALITNNGTLVIQDKTDASANGSGTGKITYNNGNPDQASVPGYASNTIINQGNLTINSGYIENTTTGGYAAYTVDNITNGGLYTPTFTMNGGKLYNNYTDAVRMFLNSTSKLNKVVINGGILDSDKSSGRVVVMHDPGSPAGMGELIITGGTIMGMVNAWSAANAGGVTDRFGDGQYEAINIEISGGSIEKLDFSSMANTSLRASSLSVTGGTYENDPSDYVSAGYRVVASDNPDFPFKVELTPAAKIGTTEYATLAEAVAAVTSGQTVTLMTDVVLTESLVIPAEKNFTLDLATYSISGSVGQGTEAQSLAGKLIVNNGTLTINSADNAGRVYNTNIDAQGRDAIYNAEGATIVINGGIFGDSDTDMTNGNNVNRGAGIRNFGTATLNGGKFTAGDNYLNSGWAYAIINGDEHETCVININDGVVVYGQNNGNIAGNAGTININGGEFNITGAKSHYCVYTYNATVNVTGGTFTKTNGANGSKYMFCVDVDKDNASNPGKINVAGGTFTQNNENTTLASSAANISLTGGTFNVNANAYCAPGYEATQSGNVWTVAEIKDVAQIGSVRYATLAAAFAAVESGQTITLLRDVTLTENPFNVTLGEKTVTLDLGTNTLTGRTNLKSGNLTIQNGNVTLADGQPLNVYGSATAGAQNYSVMTVASNVTVTGKYGVCLFGATAGTNGYGAVVNMNGTFNANNGVFVSGNLGNNVADDMHNIVNISGTLTSANDVAVALNGWATVNVLSGAQITGNTGIAVKRGVLNVATGATVAANGEWTTPPAANNSGTEPTGAAVSMTATYNNLGAMAVNIAGGTFTSANGQALYKADQTYTNAATFSVTGGTFSSDPSDFVAAGYEAVYANNLWTVQEAADVAQIGEVTYQTLAAAVAAATSGQTIKILKNFTIEGNAGVEIPAGKTITLDLNGKTIKNLVTEDKASQLILNNGTLTITDSSTGTPGTMTNELSEGIHSGQWTEYNYSTSIIYNTGTLTVEKGTLQQQASSNISYAIDNVGANTSTTVNGGNLVAGYIPIRSFNGQNKSVAIHGGTLTGLFALYLQSTTTLTIDGGTFNAPTRNAIYVEAASTINISGDCVFNYVANRQFVAFDNTAAETGSIISVTGGTFSSDPSAYVAAGYEAVDNGNGTWTVAQMQVAKIGNTPYATLAAALAAATSGQTVTLLSNVETTAQLEVDKEMTLDLNGKTIQYTGTSTLASGVIMVLRGANLTITDSGSNGSILGGEKAYAAVALTKNGETSTADAQLTVNGGTLRGHYYAIVGNGNRQGTVITVNGGTLVGVEGSAIYHPQAGTLTITGGSLRGADTGVELRSGTLNISGGTFTATAAEYSCSPNGNGSTTTGAALAIAQHTTNQAITANITGGIFEGTKKLSISNPQNNAFNNVTVSGLNTLFGDSVVVPDGYIWSNNGDGTSSLFKPVTTWDGSSKEALTVVDADTYAIYSAAQLAQFAYNVNNGTNYAGKTVVLMNDIDLNNQAWTPIGLGGNSANDDLGSETGCFLGTFDGNHKTISNLKVTHNNDDRSFAGLFGTITVTTAKTVTIKAVTVSGVDLNSEHMAAGILARYDGVSASAQLVIDGCSVDGTPSKNTITSTPFTNSQNKKESGNQAAGIVGCAFGTGGYTIQNCSVSGVTIQGTRDLGAIAGAFLPSGSSTFANNSASNCTITQVYPNDLESGKDMTAVHELVGRTPANWEVPASNKATNVTVNLQVPSVARIGDTYYTTLADAVTAAADGATIKVIKAGEYSIPAITKTLTFDAIVNGVVVNHTTNSAITTIASGKKATFKNMAFNLAEVSEGPVLYGFGTGELEMDGCTISNSLSLFGESTFNNCSFTASGKYNIWAVCADATFSGSTFINTNRAVNVYDSKHSDDLKDVVFIGCTFTGSEKKKAAINIHHKPDHKPAKYRVWISSSCSTEGTWASSTNDTGEEATTVCNNSLWMISDISASYEEDILVTDNIQGPIIIPPKDMEEEEGEW